MLRNSLMATLAASAMLGSAYAADLAPTTSPHVYMTPVPIFTWTGFYIGANAGAAFGVGNPDDNLFFPGVNPLFFANKNNGTNTRFIGGGQAGVNWQGGPVVLGVEADGQALVGNNNNNNNFFNFGNDGDNTRFLGTVRARSGIAINQ